MADTTTWRKRVATWRASGLSASEFCKGREFPAGTLYWWSSRLGPRIDAGYVAAIGIPSAGAIGTTLDAAYFAVGVDARLRVRLGRTPWLLVGVELGAALAGIDARADARRVTAQLSARVALLLGLAWAL